MKRYVKIAVGVILLACTACISISSASSDADKRAAIEKGLGYLYSIRQADGLWNLSGSEQAETGAVTFAFLSQQDKWGQNASQYKAAVDHAMAYLVTVAKAAPVDTRKDGVAICPGNALSCKGIYWSENGQATYTTGLVAPAIAAYGAITGKDVVPTSTGALAGMTWSEIAQGITNALAASQSTSAEGNRDGGWSRSIPGAGDSDNASTHSAVVSLIYDETLGAATPSVVKDEVKVWLGNIHDSSGAACFEPGVAPCDDANTGGWLMAMNFVGSDLTNPQVQAALNFLNTHWQLSTGSASTGHFGNPIAMSAVYQGLTAMIGVKDTSHIRNLLTGCNMTLTQSTRGSSDVSVCNWWEDYGQWLVSNQRTDGSWSGSIATAFYIGILGATEIPTAQSPGLINVSRMERTPRTGSRVNPSLGTGQVRTRAAVSVGIQPAAPTPPGKLRPRVREGVTAVSLSLDGNTLAEASTDNTIRTFSPLTGLQSLVLPGSLSLPTGLVFSPDGNTITSVARDSVVRIWNAATGGQIAGLAGHEQAINTVAVSANGAFLASAGEETRMFLWDLTTHRLNKVLFGPTDFVNSLSFSPDSRLLASGGEDARVLIYDVAAGKPVYTLLGHAGPIDAVVFSPDGTTLASGGQDTVIHLWDPAKGQQRLALPGHSAPIRTITFSPDSRLLASGGEDTQIILWNTATGAIEKVLSGSTGAINALVFDPKGRFLVSASAAGEITLWNVAAGIQLLTIKVPTAS